MNSINAFVSELKRQKFAGLLARLLLVAGGPARDATPML